MILFLVHFYLHATFQSLVNIEKYWLKECKRNVNHGLSCFEELKKKVLKMNLVWNFKKIDTLNNFEKVSSLEN